LRGFVEKKIRETNQKIKELKIARQIAYSMPSIKPRKTGYDSHNASSKKLSSQAVRA
jgi:hypothetical protein